MSPIRAPRCLWRVAEELKDLLGSVERQGVLVKGTDPRAAVADLVAAGSHPALRQRD